MRAVFVFGCWALVMYLVAASMPTEASQISYAILGSALLISAAIRWDKD